MLKSKNIIFEDEKYWVGKVENTYSVFITKITHSTSESSYEMNEDGLSIAIARCKYLAKMERKK